MARKKKKKKFRMPSLFSGLREETVHGIWAVLFFVLFIFFSLSAFSLAGVAGKMTYEFFYGLFGIGYYLMPVLFLMLAVTYTGNLREHLGGLRAFGAALFFLSALALIDLVFDAGGGIIGAKISGPLHELFDKATVVILIALVLISVLILFDLRFSFDFLRRVGSLFAFKKKEKRDTAEDIEVSDNYDDEYEEEEGAAEEEYEDEEVEGDEEEEEEEETKKEGFATRLFGKKEPNVDDDAGFRILPTGEHYVPPPLSLLEKHKGRPDVGDVKANANIIKRTFSNFGIDVEMDEVSIGPTVTRYALKPAEGVKLQRILGLQHNLELALAASPIRIEAPIPGKALVGIEVPNHANATVGMATILSDNGFRNADKPLTIALGKDIDGTPRFANLAKMPHCLIAGTTGSGKSVMIHALITSLLYRNSPEQLKFLMVDPKRVELTLYKGIPHLLSPVITSVKKTILALNWAIKEMERRYNVLETEEVRDIESYHANILAPALKGIDDMDEEERANLPESMPYIVIIIDELADFMSSNPREMEAAIVRLAAMSRAVGIHIVLATQSPRVNVITGLIKANIPTRLALQVPSLTDSRIIIDTPGAENLLGRGDMLYLASDSPKPIRIQSPLISESEVKKVVKYLRKRHEDDVPDIVDFTVEDGGSDALFGGGEGSDDDDPLYEQARMAVIDAKRASTSYLQRKLRIGYSRAARLMDLLEERGVIGPQDGSKPREVLDESTRIAEDEEATLEPLEEEEEYEEENDEPDEEEDEESEESDDEDEDDEGDLYSRR